MPHPSVTEIFSNQALGNSRAFQYDNQESKQQLQLSKKKSVAPQPPGPMKKFGGYKPKILAENSDLVEIQNGNNSSEIDGLKSKTRPAPTPGSAPARPPPQLTKPKPFVIGDKNVPMVLSTVGDDDFQANEDDDDDLDNNNVNQRLEDLNLYDKVIQKDGEDRRQSELEDSTQNLMSVSSDTSTLISQTEDIPRGFDNMAYSTSSLAINSETNNGHEQRTDNVFYENGHVGEEEEVVDGVFIPPPDYDEEERTIDFTSEDTDDGGDEVQKPRQAKPRPVSQPKFYEGEDLSKYFSDEDEQFQNVIMSPNEAKPRKSSSKKANSQSMKTKSSERHSLFKPQSKSKRKNSSKNGSPGFNSVRSFSYADSKFGTKGKAAGKAHNLTFSEFSDDSEMFLNTNDHQSSYENFLRTRHGEAIPTESIDSGVEMGDDQLRNKNDKGFKKLTLRMKHRLSKSIGSKEH